MGVSGCFAGLVRLLTTGRGSSATASKRTETRNAHGRWSVRCCGFFTWNMKGNIPPFPLPRLVQSLLSVFYRQTVTTRFLGGRELDGTARTCVVEAGDA